MLKAVSFGGTFKKSSDAKSSNDRSTATDGVHGAQEKYPFSRSWRGADVHLHTAIVSSCIPVYP